MVQALRYKKPRRLNVVTVPLLLLALVVGWLLYTFVPAFLIENEAYRVLEETGSKVAGQPGRYRGDAREREQLRLRMTTELRQIGVDDPGLETWIEFHGSEVRLGVAYAVSMHWPFELLPPRESITQVEHAFTVR